LYDYVFVASKKWADVLAGRLSVPVGCMWQCTDVDVFYPEFDESYCHDLLFVGNSRKVYRRIVRDVLPTDYDFAVYGADWGGLIDDKYIKGDFIGHDVLRLAYSSCRVLLNDHWDDMREKGFVSNRIFDAVACGACVISDDVDGLDDLFPGRVLTYTSRDDLHSLIDEYVHRDMEYDVSMIEGHTFKDRVDQIIDIIPDKKIEIDVKSE